MEWLWLALACAFATASGDAFTKRLLAGYDAWEITVVRLAWTAAVLLPWLAIAPWPDPDPRLWLWVAALLPLDIAAMLLYMRAISVAPLHDTLPYLAFTPVLTAATAWLVLGETVTARGLAGVCLVTAGGYLLNVDTAAGRRWRPLAPFARMRRAPGPRLMLGVALLYSLTSVLGKGALAYVPAAYFAPLYFTMLGAATIAVAGAARPRALAALWRRPLAQLVVTVFFAAMVVTHFLAIERIEAAYMIAVKRTSLLFGIVYGALLFREPHPLRHLAIGGLMVAGVALIVL